MIFFDFFCSQEAQIGNYPKPSCNQNSSNFFDIFGFCALINIPYFYRIMRHYPDLFIIRDYGV